MASASSSPVAGLEDVVATRSALAFIDGERGILAYRGYSIDDLVRLSFEQVAWLLWHDAIPVGNELAALRARFAAERALPAPIIDILRRLPASAHPLAALRTAISALGTLDPDAGDDAPEARARKALRLTAQTPLIVGAWHRIRQGLEPVAPQPTDSIAESLLRAILGDVPSPTAARAIDVALILHAEHELNASTFVVRVVVATEADLHAAIAAACAALKGPKHGGANEDVLPMLDEIGAPENAEPYVLARLAWRDTLSATERQSIRTRFSGFGHRVYRVDDPRAAHLRRMAEALAATDPTTARRLAIAEQVREVLAARRGLRVNVDYYSTIVYQALGIPTDLNTSIFAVARMAGWTAHALEQYADNRLIRPRAAYIGPALRPLPGAAA
jgi:citrate synthase